MNSITFIAFVLAGAVLTGLVVRHLRKSHIDSANRAGKGLVEAKKNTLRSELHDLGLGIQQVQGYIKALKGEDKDTVEARTNAQAELDKASQLKSEIEGAIDRATTDAQVDGFALGLEQARLHVRKARALSLAEKPEDEDDDA